MDKEEAERILEEFEEDCDIVFLSTEQVQIDGVLDIQGLEALLFLLSTRSEEEHMKEMFSEDQESFESEEDFDGEEEEV